MSRILSRILPVTYVCWLLFITVPNIKAEAPEGKKLITANNQRFFYSGRFDTHDPLRPTFMYSGSSISFAFKGTSVDLLMQNESSNNYYNIIIDGTIKVINTNITDSVYHLASGLPDKRHDVVIFRRTEWHGGNSIFLGVYLNESARMLKFPAPRHRIEFIGNSITCAYGNEGSSNKDHFRYDTENNYLSYAAITARALNAQYVAICRSGIGLYTGRGDTTFAMPKLYDEVCKNCSVRWDYSFKPQVIAIELGNNDFAVDPDSVTYVNVYRQFIRRLRSHNPRAVIICMAGPYSAKDAKWAHFQHYVQSVVGEARTTDGFTGIYYFNLGNFIPNGADWHPSKDQHEQMSIQLTAYIRRITGW